MQTRRSQAEFTAYKLDLEKRRIPVNAILHDFRVGPGHEGPAPHDRDVVSFHYEGHVYFNVKQTIVGKTAIVIVESMHEGSD